MKNSNSIPHNLNTIFHKLNNATNITITCTRSSNLSETQEKEPDFTIHEVNGFKTPAEYYDFLLSLCAGARLAIINDLQHLHQSEKAAFLMEAFNRVDFIREKVSTVILPAETSSQEPTRYLSLKGFNNVTFDSDNKQSSPPSANNRSLLIQQDLYACQLKKAINILSMQLITIATTIEHHQDICIVGSLTSPYPLKKLRIRGSVPYAATFGRILYDDDIFDIHNKSEFCRIFSSTFSTIQQDDISWHSLKNHFNCPSLEALNFWDIKISDWRKYIRKLTILN